MSLISIVTRNAANEGEPTAYILLLNIFDRIPTKTYKALKPANAVIISPKDFDKKLFLEAKRKKIGVVGTPGKIMGQNCEEVLN
jgi:hypothetical protein